MYHTHLSEQQIASAFEYTSDDEINHYLELGWTDYAYYYDAAVDYVASLHYHPGRELTTREQWYLVGWNAAIEATYSPIVPQCEPLPIVRYPVTF